MDKTLREILRHVKIARSMCLSEYGTDVLRAGSLRELLVADILGHEVVGHKKGIDARDEDGNAYEYLCAEEGRVPQFHFGGLSKDNSYRVSRNAAFFFATFVELTVSRIWRVPTKYVVERVVQRQTGLSMGMRGAKVKNISKYNVIFSLAETIRVGKLVYHNPDLGSWEKLV